MGHLQRATSCYVLMLSFVCFCQDFILEHYSEDGNNYEDEIADLMDLRQVVYNHSLI